MRPGLKALEIAQVLDRAGERVDLLAIFDTSLGMYTKKSPNRVSRSLSRMLRKVKKYRTLLAQRDPQAFLCTEVVPEIRTGVYARFVPEKDGSE